MSPTGSPVELFHYCSAGDACSRVRAGGEEYPDSAPARRTRIPRRDEMSSPLTPDGGTTLEESGGETYEDLTNLGGDDDE